MGRARVTALTADEHPSPKAAPCPSETAQRITLAARDMLLLTL